MAKRANASTKRKFRIVQSAVLVCVAILALLVTYFPKLGLPSWSDFFRLSGTNQTVNAAEYPFSVHFIDVGQADSALILCENEAVLIDAGDVDSYAAIDAYLKAQNVKQLKYFILTHAHADHIGSADDVLKNYAVENVIMPKYSEENMPTSKVYEDLLYALSDSGAKVLAAKAGHTYNLSGCSFSVYAPNKDYKELNDSSVVVRFTYGETNFLFQGDAAKASENDVLAAGFDVRADVLKMGHHGSKTSSTEKYLRAVSPKLAVISCGENNSYKLPSDSVLQRLTALGIEYRRTDRNGTIVVMSNGKEITVQTEK